MWKQQQTPPSNMEPKNRHWPKHTGQHRKGETKENTKGIEEILKILMDMMKGRECGVNATVRNIYDLRWTSMIDWKSNLRRTYELHVFTGDYSRLTGKQGLIWDAEK